MNTTLTYLFFAAVLLASLIPYVRRMRQKEAAAVAAAERAKLFFARYAVNISPNRRIAPRGLCETASNSPRHDPI